MKYVSFLTLSPLVLIACGASSQPRIQPEIAKSNGHSCTTAEVMYVLPHDLPHAPSAEEMAKPLFVIALHKDGRFAVNGTLLANPQDLRTIAREAFAKDSNVRAVIAADAAVSWGEVLRVMDILKQNQIGKIAFAVGSPNIE